MDQDLSIQITADASEAESGINVTTETLQKLEAAIEQLTAGIPSLNATFEQLTGASTESSTGLDKTSAAALGANESLRALGGQTGQAARGLEALGFGAGEAAARVEGLTGALAGLDAAAPGLIAIGAVLSAAFAGFDFLKTGIKDASDAQAALRELSIADAAAGRSTAGMTESVQKWAEAMEEAAGVSESQTIPAVLRLVDAGESVSGAMTIATVAAQMVEAGMGRMRGSTDMAESSQQRYNQVLLAFYQAMDGNYTMISRIDPAVRKLVEAHAPLPAIIEAINKQTQDSIEKNNTNAETWARVQGILRATGEEIGATTLPAITRLGQYVFGMVEACRESGKAFSALGHDIVTVVGGSIDAIGQLASSLAQLSIAFGAASSAAIDFAKGDMGSVKSDIAGVGHAIGESGKWVTTLEGNLHRIGSAWNDVATQETRIQDSLNKALETGSKHLQTQLDLLHRQASDSRGVYSPAYRSTGGKGGTGAGAVPGASAYEEDQGKYTVEEDKATRDLTDTTNRLNDVEDKRKGIQAQLTEAVKLATTSEQEYAAKAALSASQASDNRNRIADLNAAIQSETQHHTQLQQVVANMTQTLKADEAAQRSHTTELAGAHKEILATREETSIYAAAVHDASMQLDDATRASKAYDEAIKQHNTELAAAILKQFTLGQTVNEELQRASASSATSSRKQRLTRRNRTLSASFQASSSWSTTGNKGSKITKTSSIIRTRRTRRTWSSGRGATRPDVRNANQELDQLYQQNLNNYKQVSDQMANGVTQFVDKVFIEHKNLRTELKSIWEQILQDFIGMLNKMLETLMQSGLEKFLSQFLGGGGVSLTQWENTPEPEITSLRSRAVHSVRTPLLRRRPEPVRTASWGRCWDRRELRRSSARSRPARVPEPRAIQWPATLEA